MYIYLYVDRSKVDATNDHTAVFQKDPREEHKQEASCVGNAGPSRVIVIASIGRQPYRRGKVLKPHEDEL